MTRANWHAWTLIAVCSSVTAEAAVRGPWWAGPAALAISALAVVAFGWWRYARDAGDER